jgi:nitrate reductase beta subunit
MRIRAQMAMVMNLDKCIGCHTCTVTCKQVWTNRPGTEYVYFNNVETKPGTGYPRRYEDQEQWKGGWTLDRKGRLQLKSGSRLRRLLSIFYNPDLPSIDDYGDPWTYDYQTLINAPLGTPNPSAHSISALTGKDMSPRWGSNWDDDLAGGPDHAAADPDLAGLGEQVKLAFEQVFMFYLPRICEHCLNPSCVASCPSGAMYKRDEDGIVLVDQDRCRGWRFCVSGCPYKKVYFNHRTGKAEKCTLCFPRIEAGQPTICSETCVGRLRYLGLILYDADAVLGAAATSDPRDLYHAQLSVFVDPEDPGIQAEAARQGIPADWIDAARRSPVHALIARHRVALPVRVQRIGHLLVFDAPRLDEHALERDEPGVVARDVAVRLDAVARRQDHHLVEPVEVLRVAVRLRQVGVVEGQPLEQLDGRTAERDTEAEDPHGRYGSGPCRTAVPATWASLSVAARRDLRTRSPTSRASAWATGR